ncbi:MAG: group II intron reverse transcriptase/maturase [Dissulfurispiraceae bacterium]
MNTGVNVCASSYGNVQWPDIDWAQCIGNVRRLQMCIVKATQESRWNKVKVLQRLLTGSFSGKALAVKRVTENEGKKTAGVDRQLWSTPESKSQAVQNLNRRGYKPLPLRRVYIPKSRTKMRPLGIPTMKDRAMHAVHLSALEPISETKADRNSYGFRPERATQDAIKQCFIILSKKTSAKWILEGDIRGCFDNINHEWLINNIPMDKKILRKWLKTGYIHKRILYPTEAGTPQGGIISPTLANMTLDGLEVELKKFRRQDKVHMVRYADDFIVTGNSEELLENEVKPLVEKFLSTRGLELSPEKTRITHIDKGFDFLGVNIRKYGGKLLIKPSKKNVKTFLDNVRNAIKDNKAAKQINLINLLNPIIRGWANYHKSVVAKETFKHVDDEIWKLLWRWANRRHPDKSPVWITKKYFKKAGGRNWAFAVEDREKFYPNGKPLVISLFRASDTPIKRYIKIRGEANPFDPQFETYFEERSTSKIRDNLKENKRFLSLWSNQGGNCSVCHQRITDDMQWSLHHITRKVEGGNNNVSNLKLTHHHCHRKVHGRKLEVVEPATERRLMKGLSRVSGN